ncbi:TadE-like protein [Methylobacterium sp. 174MFSha1.1]|uniref:TadE/TadG family type IV pilus assembly protein n=1 Tax=Methylobacterium sp. 174MFSha1.1 TaxID=1502749 RepID=UPI0008E55C20|nr:TadE/TadG family type IV pilus assembly protein [Methylobacterium sp. 174MFSha1.1]SFU49409.1 TadE-like protein [Methylobacterium sp. 174MFSha1.1]
MHPAPSPVSRLGLRRLLLDRRGVAAVEFALLTPILLALLLSLFDACLAFRQMLRVVNANAAAANYAISAGAGLGKAGLAAFAADVAAIVRGSADGFSTAEVTVLINNAADGSSIETFYCVSGSPPRWTATGSSSTACGDSATSGKFVTITVSLPYQPLIRTSGAFTRFAAIADTVTARIQ